MEKFWETGSRSIRLPTHTNSRGPGLQEERIILPSGKNKERGKETGRPENNGTGFRTWSETNRKVGRIRPGLQQFRKYATLQSLLESALVILLVAYVFYYSPIAIPFLLPLAVPVTILAGRRQEKKKKKELMLAFKEMTASLLTELKAGYSVENSLRECWKEMAYLYGENGVMTKELACIVHGMDNQIPVETLMMGFADRSEVEEIREFAEVFVIARKSGGNLTQIMQRTIHVIQNRMDTESEIETMISGRKMEQRIMDAVPFVIILYIRLTSRGFFDVLYHNTAGVAIMSVCLAVYLAAFGLSERVTNICV